MAQHGGAASSFLYKCDGSLRREAERRAGRSGRRKVMWRARSRSRGAWRVHGAGALKRYHLHQLQAAAEGMLSASASEPHRGRDGITPSDCRPPGRVRAIPLSRAGHPSPPVEEPSPWVTPSPISTFACSRPDRKAVHHARVLPAVTQRSGQRLQSVLEPGPRRRFRRGDRRPIDRGVASAGSDPCDQRRRRPSHEVRPSRRRRHGPRAPGNRGARRPAAARSPNDWRIAHASQSSRSAAGARRR